MGKSTEKAFSLTSTRTCIPGGGSMASSMEREPTSTATPKCGYLYWLVDCLLVDWTVGEWRNNSRKMDFPERNHLRRQFQK